MFQSNIVVDSSGHDQLSIHVEVVYDMTGNKEMKFDKLFHSSDQAVKWLGTQRLIYIRSKLKAFVNHKKILSEKTSTWCRPEDRSKKIKSLESCIRELSIINDKNLYQVSVMILRIYWDLVNILPLQNSATFSSQIKNLNDISQLAVEVINENGIAQ